MEAATSSSRTPTWSVASPLNLFFRENEAEVIAAAGRDYGQSIKDLAASNIFPGDLLTKNFGVTRHAACLLRLR